MKGYNGEILDDLAWQQCSNFQCQQCGKTFWLPYTGKLEKINLLFCNDCFEDDKE